MVCIMHFVFQFIILELNTTLFKVGGGRVGRGWSYRLREIKMLSYNTKASLPEYFLWARDAFIIIHSL